MGDKRKLQADVDRCIKKINEGKANFDELKIKMQTAQNSNQREKFESDMKREIKRLQRLREQLKTWLGSNDIKDKSALNAARRTIEEQMESFKVIEKEAKTKAYSRDGLISAAKKDPVQQRREEFDTWVNDMFSSLRRQIEEYEAELELMAKPKARKPSKDQAYTRSVLEKKIGEHNEHIANLEKVLRLVDNESLELSEVEEIKDDVEYYVDEHSQENFIRNDNIYSKLGLDRVVVSNTPQLITEVISHPSKPDPAKCRKPFIDKAPIKQDATKTAVGEVLPTSQKAKPVQALEKSQLPTPGIEKSLTVSPVVENVEPPLKIETSQAATTSSDHKSAENNLPDVNSPNDASVKHPSSNPVGHVASSPKKVKAEEKATKETAKITKGKESPPEITEDNILRGEPLKIVSECATVTPLNPPFKLPVNRMAVPSSSSSEKSQEENVGDQSKVASGSETMHRKWNLLEKIMSQEKIRERVIQTNNDAVTDHSNFIWNFSLKHTRHIDEESILDEFDSFNEHYDAMKSSYVLRKEHSQHNSISSIAVSVPECHNLPTKQLFMYPEFFNILSLNVLFFIFYNYQGTCAQYNAAKAIKNKQWRYHRGLKLWFIRQCEPKVMTMDFEQGNYYYFDTDNWQKVYVQDFRFEFQYLEDKLLV